MTSPNSQALCTFRLVLFSLVNTHYAGHRTRGTKGFKVYLSLQAEGPWTQVLEKELEDPLSMPDPLPLMNYPISPTFARFVKFEIVSFWGTNGGGLQYFALSAVDKWTWDYIA